MKNILITGSSGFVGKNLVLFLQQRYPDYTLLLCDKESGQLSIMAQKADFVFHLAGANRVNSPNEFDDGNRLLTEQLLTHLSNGKEPPVAFASSIQADLDNPYGESKRNAEKALLAYDAPSYIFRFPNIYGKFCRPNYNSVVATFCYNLAHHIPISVNEPDRVLTLIYIDEVCERLMSCLEGNADKRIDGFCNPGQTHQITVKELAELLTDFSKNRETLILPDLNDELTRNLLATYISYLPDGALTYPLDLKSDARGVFFECIKAAGLGQISISRTKPGVTRGNHWHHSKLEKFLVLEGEAVVSLRKIGADERIDLKVSGEEPTIIDIPPGYTHNIKNTGNSELITLFWAGSLFDPIHPDTFFEEV